MRKNKQHPHVIRQFHLPMIILTNCFAFRRRPEKKEQHSICYLLFIFFFQLFYHIYFKYEPTIFITR